MRRIRVCFGSSLIGSSLIDHVKNVWLLRDQNLVRRTVVVQLDDSPDYYC